MAETFCALVVGLKALRTRNGEGRRVSHRSRPVRNLTSVVPVVRRRHIVDGQDAAKDRVVVNFDAVLAPGMAVELPLVLGPGYVQRLVTLAAGAHQLGPHPLRNVILEAKRRYPRRDYKGRFNLHVIVLGGGSGEGDQLN